MRPVLLRWRTAVALAAALTTGPVLGLPADAQPSTARPASYRVVADDRDRLPPGWRLRATRFAVQLSWRAGQPLPLTDARPEFRLDGNLLGYPQLSAGGQLLTLPLRTTPPDLSGLSVWLSGRRLDRTIPARRTGPATPYVHPDPTRPLDVDPGEPGPYDTVTRDYRLPPRPLAPFSEPVEMRGHVVAPTGAPGNRPFVLFLHGRHATCYVPGTRRVSGNWPCRPHEEQIPSHLGYHYAQRLLASQGYVTVSISANGINGQDFLTADGGSAARSVLVRRHLQEWANWAARPGTRLAGSQRDLLPDVDLEQVLLVGHSRGGEGVDRAAIDTRLADPWRIRGQVLIGPTAFGRQEAPYVPTVVLLPYCDGDVIDLQGQAYVDVGRDILADPALRSAVMVVGANHNFFNTEWTPGISVAPSFDDWFADNDPMCGTDAPTRLSARGQRAVGTAYIAGAARLLLRGDERVLPMYDGSRVRVPSAGDADVRTAALGGDRKLVRPGRGTVVGSTDARVQLCVGLSGRNQERLCGRDASPVRTPHWPGFGVPYPVDRAVELAWQARGAHGGLQLDRPVDLSAATHLDARVVVATGPGPVRLGVRLEDADGNTLELGMGPKGRLVPLPGRGLLGKLWAQTLRVRLPPRTAGFDLGSVRRIELVGRSADGRVWLLDLAGRRPGLVPVPERRVPKLNVEGASVVEGNGPAPGVLNVPLTVDGPLSRTAKVRVLVFDFFEGPTSAPVDLILDPGQDSAVVPVEYERDDRDDLDVHRFAVMAYPASGVMTADYIGIGRVRDDDPTPAATFQPVDRRVPEGKALRWRIRLERPVDYAVFYRLRAVRAQLDLRQLSTADVPRRWLRRHGVRPPDEPESLARARPYLSVFLEAGERRAFVRVPTVRDGRDEGREVLALLPRERPTLPDPVPRTVTVRDR